MTKLKGFALIGKATPEQLKNYKLHYIEFVDIKFSPIWEANKFLSNWLGKDKGFDYPSEDRVLSWCQSREFIARWSFDEKDLDRVLGLWREMMEYQASQKEWDASSHWPEKNFDWFE